MTDPSSLAVIVKYAGLLIAVIGCIIVAPIGHVVADIRAGVHKKGGLIRAALARKFPRFRRTITAQAGTAIASSIAARATVTTTSTVWSPDDPADERIERLRKDFLRLEERHNDLVRQIAKEKADQEQALSDLERRLLGETEKLREIIEEKERESVEIDGRGFWPILVGLILTNTASEVAYLPWLAWLSMLVSAAVTGLVIKQTLRWRRAISQ